MKKLAILLLIFCVVVAGCKKKLATDASQSSTSNPADLIPPPPTGPTGPNIATVTEFINHYAGVYYSQGLHYYKHDNSTDTGYKVDYKFRDGKIYTYDQHNEGTQLIIEPVEAVLASEKKIQLRHKEDGEVLVFNMTDDGLESYVSYILEKVSEDVLIQNAGIGGNIPELAEYKGTYNSLAQDNKIENYIAIDEEGNVYFHDASITIDGGRVSITDGGELTILESHNGSMRKIIFKFDQGVYRRFAIDGPREGVDETYIGICEMTKDFIEDVFDNAILKTEDFEELEGLYQGTPDYTPTKATGYCVGLNEPPGYRPIAAGAVCFTGNVGQYFAGRDNVMHISVLKGNTLHIMGKYNVALEFSPDWKTATYNGQTLTLVSGEIKATAAPAERRASRRIK